MLSKYNYDKILNTVKNVGISVGTQILHLNHVMHGIDPVVLKKGDIIAAYALFVWENHQLEDLDEFIPDIAAKKLQSASRVIDKSSIKSDILDSITRNVSYNREVDASIKQINEDYNVAIDAIEKITTGHIEEVNLKKINEVASHIDNTEIHKDASEEDELEVVHHELHDSVIQEIEKRKEFEARINSILSKNKS